jgi:hypothetical protein
LAERPISFENMFYGDFSYRNFSLVTHVDFDRLTISLLGVMVALMWVSRATDLDGVPRETVAQISEKSSKSAEPEFLEVEIVPPEEDRTRKRPSDHPRLKR